MTPLLLAAAMLLGQPPAPAPAAGPQARRWIDTMDRSGRPIRISGWLDAQGRPRFNPAEYPQVLAPAPEAGRLPFPSPLPPVDGSAIGAASATKPAEGGDNFGLDLRRTFGEHRGEQYHASGDRGRRFVEAAKAGVAPLADDSDKPFLTAIGEPGATAKVEEALKAGPLSEFRDLVRFQAFRPEEWQVTSVGLPSRGRPTIILQAPDGTVLFHQEDFEGGGKALAEHIAGKLRRPNPDYDPSLDPGPNARGGEWALPAILGVVVLLIVLRKKGNVP